MTIHVTTSPGEAVIERCWENLNDGYKPILATIWSSVATAEGLADNNLHRYIGEFEGRHNQRSSDTIDQMSAMAQGMIGKRLSYRDWVG